MNESTYQEINQLINAYNLLVKGIESQANDNEDKRMVV